MATKIARRAVRRIVATWTVVLMALAASRSVEAVPIVSVGSATVGVGDLVTIPVFIDEATDLTFWQFDLAFDPVEVQANTITEGPFLIGLRRHAVRCRRHRQRGWADQPGDRCLCRSPAESRR